MGFNNAPAIQAAINAASAAGGGRVLVPVGRFTTGPIELRSGVELHVSSGAELLGSTHRLDYGKEWITALIFARGQSSIALSGSGIVNGQGREVVKDLISLLHDGILQDETWSFKRPSERNRPRLIAFTDCDKVSIKQITLKNSAGWVQDFVGCNGVNIDSIRVESTEYWNNDGIDIVNSRDVRITNCDIDAADDGICLKSEGKPGICENVYVENCVIRSSASGFKLGTGSFGGFRNIMVRNITVYNTYRSAIALEAVDGGFIENVDIADVKVKYSGNAIFIRLGHRNQDERYSSIKNIRISKLTAEIPNEKPDAGYPIEGPLPKVAAHNLIPASITGLPGHNVENVVIEDISIIYGGGALKSVANIPIDKIDSIPENPANYPEFSMFGELPCWAIYLRHVKGVTLNNVRFSYKKEDFRPAIVLDDVQAAVFKNVEVKSGVNIPVLVQKNCSQVTLKSIKLPFKSDKAIMIKD